MSKKQKNNGSNSILELIRNNSVPLMFIIICAVCIPISGFSPGYLLNEIVTRMENFLDESVNGHMEDYCDDSDEAIIISKEFRQKIGKSLMTSEILRFRLVIITDHILSKQVKSISQEDFIDRPTEVQLWTIDRIFNSITSNSSEIIEFDTSEFGCEGVQFLKAEIGSECEYEAYLGIIPGYLLAQMYLKWGSKLLQGNVRAFLSARGKVNKGIRDTIINAPYNFFTYNNGILIHEEYQYILNIVNEVFLFALSILFYIGM